MKKTRHMKRTQTQTRYFRGHTLRVYKDRGGGYTVEIGTKHHAVLERIHGMTAKGTIDRAERTVDAMLGD